jgi:hypothetical protein
MAVDRALTKRQEVRKWTPFFWTSRPVKNVEWEIAFSRDFRSVAQRYKQN